MVSPLFGGPSFGEPLFGEAEQQESGVGITLDRLYIHTPDREGTQSNALLGPVAILNPPGQTKELSHIEGTFKLAGWAKPFKVYAEIEAGSLRCSGIIPRSQSADLTTLKQIHAARSIVCARDQKGNLMFGRIGALTQREHHQYYEVQFDVVQSEYAEEV